MKGLSNQELVNRLWLESTDPTVRKLLEIFNEESLIDELKSAGMDIKNMAFESDYQWYSPAEYIHHLRSDVQYYMDEADDLRNEVDALNREINRLSTISLVNFIAEVKHKLEMTTMEKDRAVRAAENDRKLREDAEQKFEFWEKLHYGIK